MCTANWTQFYFHELTLCWCQSYISACLIIRRRSIPYTSSSLLQSIPCILHSIPPCLPATHHSCQVKNKWKTNKPARGRKRHLRNNRPRRCFVLTNTLTKLFKTHLEVKTIGFFKLFFYQNYSEDNLEVELSESDPITELKTKPENIGRKSHGSHTLSPSGSSDVDA